MSNYHHISTQQQNSLGKYMGFYKDTFCFEDIPPCVPHFVLPNGCQWRPPYWPRWDLRFHESATMTPTF